MVARHKVKQKWSDEKRERALDANQKLLERKKNPDYSEADAHAEELKEEYMELSSPTRMLQEALNQDIRKPSFGQADLKSRRHKEDNSYRKSQTLKERNEDHSPIAMKI